MVMERRNLIEARKKAKLSQGEMASRIKASREAVSQWERGVADPQPAHVRALCGLFEIDDPTDLLKIEDDLPEDVLCAPPFLADDLLTNYVRGIAACQDLYYNGNPRQVEAILPLYCNQIALLARQASPLQQSAARLASQAQQLACELATDREDFGIAQQAGKQAFLYAQLAGDSNLQVAALISLANLNFHLSSANPSSIRKYSSDALQFYQHAVSLLENATPLLKGRTYAGIAEVYAMRGQFQEAMRAMGLAYEHFPMKPEEDPAYPYLRASRYSLYVFGDAQTRLFLNQPKEADKALIAMQKETNDPQIEPITKLDMLYYQVGIQLQQGELGTSCTILTEAAILARNLGSRLYFNKLAASYHQLEEQWSKEPLVAALKEVFRP
jgi:transcriptional regulator with XRE-family HTH domain